MDEISQLQDYLAAGGKLLLTSSVYAQTPQLDAVLAQFGLARARGHGGGGRQRQGTV